MSPPATVIVATRDTRELTVSCLGAFAPALHGAGWRVVVVDNASADGTAAAVAARFPFAEVVRSERNLGWAGGCNLGLDRAAGDAVILVNSDVIASPEALVGLAHEIAREPALGVVSPGLRTASGAAQAFAYGGDPTLAYLLRRGARALLGRGPLHDWEVRRPLDVDWVSGACMAVRRAALARVGKLDERFPLYLEDCDWCLRFRRAGFRVRYDPRFPVTHLGGRSMADRGAADRLAHRSLVLFHAKHYGAASALAVRCLLVPYRLLRAARG